MPLNTTQFFTDLQSAFLATTWDVCGNLLGTAFDNFLKSATVSTDVTGLVTPPPPATPYTAFGKGTSTSITTTGLSTMQSAIRPSFLSKVWAGVGSKIAAAVQSDVITATVKTSVKGVLIGTGTGSPGCINTAATLSKFILDMENAFISPSLGKSWDAVSNEIVKITKTYLTGATVTTIDNGVIPPNSWVSTLVTGTIS